MRCWRAAAISRDVGLALVPPRPPLKLTRLMLLLTTVVL